MREINLEQDRIDLFISGKVVETVNNLEHLDLHQDDTLAGHVADEIQRIDAFVRQNLEGFRKIMKKYVKKQGLSKAWLVDEE